MTVLLAQLHEYLNSGDSDRRVVSVYSGQDRDHMTFAGHLILSTEDAEQVVAVLDGQDKHEIEIERHGWTVRHPLACRLDLFGCEANGHDLGRVGDGRYLLEQDEDGYWSLGEKTA